MYGANERPYPRIDAASSASKSRYILKRAGCFLLAILLAFALIPLGAFANKAYAADVWLEIGAEVHYGGYSTNEFWVDGVIAYCGEPAKATPGSGTYNKVAVYTNRQHTDVANDPEDLIKTLWFGYGGPGFDPNMWPRYDYLGNPMSTSEYIAATHLMVADEFSNRAFDALAGVNSQYYDWACREILMFDGVVGEYSWDNVEGRIRDNAWKIPASFSSECFCITTGAGNQVICGHNPGGFIDLHKASTNTDITNGNPNYVLKSARYDVFSDAACTRKLMHSYTDTSGHATYYVKPGTYYIKETISPTGYAKDETVYTVHVTNGSTSELDMKDIPQSCAPDALLEKYDSELGYIDTDNLPQGSASLAGAQFNVRYYAGYHSSVAAAEAAGAPVRTWVFETDDTGTARLEEAYKVSGDDLYLNSEGTPTLPLGTYVISETVPPTGYLNDDTHTFLRQVTANGTVEQALYDVPLVGDQVMRGNIHMEKRDAESGSFTPLGAASLDGAAFQVVNDSAHAVLVDGLSREPGDVCATLSIKDNVAQLPERSLPYGHYLIQEVAAGEGYRLTDGLPRAFDITYDGETVNFTDDLAFYNYVNRGDLQLVKAHDVDMQRLTGIPFRITSETTGESHVMLTNENGELNTSATRVPHTHNTNANDAPESGSYDNCDTQAGIWFGLTQEGNMVPPDDSLGALPYDSYTVEELRCKANDGYTLLKLEHVWVRQNDVTVDLGTLQDTKPAINTFALDAVDGDKLVMAEPDAQVIDRVEYSNLFPDKEYTLTATLIDSADGQPVADRFGNIVIASKSFTPEDVNGIVNVAIQADFTALGDRELVVFEELTCKDEVVAEHKDASSAAQTFWTKAPRLMTNATDAADGDGRVIASDQCTIVDSVSYFNLVPGCEYTLQGKLMVRNNDGAWGAEDPAQIANEDGSPVERTVTFVPDQPTGTVDVDLSFNGTDMPENFDIVVFETLMKDDVVIASHEDMNDTAQTVEFCYPAIETIARDMHDGDKAVAGDVESVVLDSVKLTDLVPNKNYTLYGALVDKSSEYASNIDWGAVINAAENTAAGTAAFPWIAVAKADVNSPSGQANIEMEYALDQHGTGQSSLFSGHAVVLAILMEGDHAIARHCSVENEDQTVEVIAPAVATEAVDFTDGDHNVMPSMDMVVLDTVQYKGLVSGQEYEIRGTLMDKAARTKLTIDDKTIEESLIFTPNSADGSITVALPVDTSKLPIGTEIVVFEQVFKDGEPIADDKDFGNLNETVQVNRNLRSTAYAKTGIPYQLIPIAVGLLLAGGLPLAYLASKRMSKRDCKDHHPTTTD